MLAPETAMRDHNGMMLLDIPKECVIALICGARASEQTMQELQAAAENPSCEYLQMKVVRSNAVPYFVDSNGASFTFDGEGISPAVANCRACKEPVASGGTLCPWCRINDTHKKGAMNRNSYRMLDHLGMLEEYVRGMDVITYGRKS